jgi:hypothetical protein
MDDQDSYEAWLAKRRGHLGSVATPKGKAQRLGTQDTVIGYVSSFFGFLINNLGVPRDDASLSQLGSVTAVEAFFKYMKDNKPDKLPEDRALSKHDAKSLLTFDQIIDFIAQDTSFRDELKPMPGHLDEHDVNIIQRHWKRHCQEVSASLDRLFENEIPQCKKRFDNEAMIDPILSSKQPMRILHDLRQAAQARVESAKTKFYRAVALRDLFIIAVTLTLCLFRPKTVCHLDWLPGDKGNSCFQFTDRDDRTGWWIFAKKEFFKNFDKPILQQDYLRMIRNIDGLNQYVEEYLYWARGFLLDGSSSHCLVVNTSAHPRFNPDAYGDHVRHLTNRLLTEDLAGKWPSTITHLTVTHVRKIVATALHYEIDDPAYTEVKNALMNEVPEMYSRIPRRKRSLATENFVEQTARNK